jgi:hypothetical protein
MRLLLIAAALVAAGCGSKEPFALVKASGRIAYEDGTLIPAEGNNVRLSFHSLTPPLDAKTHPRLGIADVELKDGTFACVTTHHWADGLIVGRHKVVISTRTRHESPKGVPPEYCELETTPLEIDTSQLPLQIKIHKPRPESRQ